MSDSSKLTDDNLITDEVTDEEKDFMDKCFIALLPFAVTQTSWCNGDKPIKSVDDRLHLAGSITRSCLKVRRGGTSFSDGEEK